MIVSGEVPNEYVEAAKFYASKLMDGRLVRHLNVEIVLDNSLPYAGKCCSDDDHSKPRYFLIHLNPNAPGDHVLQALAHEMVHVKQYATGELFDFMNGWVSWKGQKFQMLGNDCDEYESYPWEKMAYDLEESLFEDWLSIEILE
ncbi:hypothetical protein [Caulobacter phage Cr30]|uniref:hypothetical protein n=1 Tax=Caulobacter phage Cr30 TaxID=1357714 RepID=UPI0004A9B686|nr:hypothetical protein OZ74_gp087 [Caulobacter phage Cr30]AGS80972.1 hypothetical protein [Caulobacter phage Cr30]